MSSQQNMAKATENFVNRCKEMFKAADADGSGSLSIGEMKRLISDMCNSETKDSVIAEIFVDLDDDGDKKVTWDEFSEVCMAKTPKSVQEDELRCCFKKFDKDGSGMLTEDEIRAAFQAAGVKGDPMRNIESFDKDGDGRLNTQEFISAWKSQLDD